MSCAARKGRLRRHWKSSTRSAPVPHRRTRSDRCASRTTSISAPRELPAAQLARATGLKVHLYGSLSATGKGHGTERAALAGIIGKEPATIDPAFLDDLAAHPDRVFPVTLGGKTFNASLQDIVYDATQGNFPHPNTMTCKLMAGSETLLEQEYYSVGGGFIEWKGYTPPNKGAPRYPYDDDGGADPSHPRQQPHRLHSSRWRTRCRCRARAKPRSTPSSTRSLRAMDAIVKTGLAAPTSTLPGPIKLKTKAHDVYERTKRQEGTARRGVGPGGGVRACRIGRERARPPGRHRADRRFGRRDPGGRLFARTRRRAHVAGPHSQGHAGRRGDRLSLQAQRNTLRRRRRLPGGDRRRIRDGRRAVGRGVRGSAASRGQRRGRGACSTTSA